MTKARKRSLRYTLVGVWVLFTCSLLVWWIVFGFEQLSRLIELGDEGAQQAARFQRMLLWEGGTLLLSLIGGGLTLAYFMYKELRASDRVRQFFISFTHDTRTALASVLLRAELLRDELPVATARESLEGLITDIDKLSLQLDNSLASSNAESLNLHLEPLVVQRVLERAATKFPKLEVRAESSEMAMADTQALENVLTNLLHNSLSHGKATKVSCLIERDNEWCRITLTDNGSGFKGEPKKLGCRLYRHYAGSGTGLGLSLVTELMHKMGGSAQFPPSSSGFTVILKLPACAQES